MDRRILLGTILLAAAAAMMNCGVDTNDGPAYQFSDFTNPHPKLDTSIPDAGVPDANSDASIDAAPPSTDCTAAQTAERLPARSVTHRDATLPNTRRVFVDDMFSLFRSLCGGCHIDANQGNWQTSRKAFNETAARESLLSMLRNDSLDKVMPPGSVGGKLAKDRTPDDPSLELMKQLRAYIAAGGPPQTYLESVPTDVDTSVQDADDAYRMELAVADAQTTLGNCIPGEGLYATELERMGELDAYFFSATPKDTGTLLEKMGLPEHLKDTDLFTFDAVELAKHGVVAYAPAYPVFVDNARSIRHVRVPVGESIGFDPTTQQFVIPEATRFYKTLLKPVVELDGSVHWKKMETQLIVAWNDQDSLGSGWRAVVALSGTYLWNEEETDARLVTDPLKSGDPFRDHVLTYVSDEQKAAPIIASSDAKGQDPGYYLKTSGATHHYATPWARRCGECHMGSPSKNFVLGFQPLQIKRRPKGTGGVIDEAGSSELSQIQRFIQYGLLTGIKSEDEILNLENSQGERKPRNEYELIAQGYLLGNCASCHNPRGAASFGAPELKEILDFQPSATGGIFQFGLEVYSPRIFRAGADKVKIPYITPSLFDMPWQKTASTFWLRKCSQEVGVSYPDGIQLWHSRKDCSLAPWRSLIYRGVDTPFTYSDDLALFPRMPAHTPGYDCRAPRIIADWMVSIPAVRKLSPMWYPEDAVLPTDGSLGFHVDESPQPYVEVKSGDERYADGAAEAARRHALYRGETVEFYSGYPRYEFCAGNTDIVDPSVTSDNSKPVPSDAAMSYNGGTIVQDNVPDAVHWVILDSTQVPGLWYPRRADWTKILIEKSFPTLRPSDAGYTAAKAAQDHEKLVVEVLQNTLLSDTLRTYAARKVPMGLWAEKPNCDFTRVPKMKNYDSAPAKWMTQAENAKYRSTDAPVYAISPGEFIYDQACAQCHGTQANSSGQEATTLAEMTGGYATVTNFKTGIGDEFNRLRIFGEYASAATGTVPDDWAARYYAWMGLGGTLQRIPSSILTIVATNDVLGVTRSKFTPPKDANMLAIAETLCLWTLPAQATGNAAAPVAGDIQISLGSATPETLASIEFDGSPLVKRNGDAEVWQRICTMDNPRPVRALTLQCSTDGTSCSFGYDATRAYYASKDYPPDTPVADQNGHVANGVTADNAAPWCIRSPATPEKKQVVDQWIAEHPALNGRPVPYCPERTTTGADYIVAATNDTSATDPGPAVLKQTELVRWSIRGAINAGLATFIHVDNLTLGLVKPTPNYNECEQLSN